MSDRDGGLSGPKVYSIAAHRGFADALVAGLVPRYFDPDFGLSRLTLIVPSSRAARTISEAFIRHFGNDGREGLLMPRMAMVGDLDLDETLGSLMDPMGADDIPAAVEPMQRWLELADVLAEALGDDAPSGAALLRLSRETAAVMDRLLVEEITPDRLLDDAVLGAFQHLSEHWQLSTRQFAICQAHWQQRLADNGLVDASTRRNMLFDRAAQRWRETPPVTPIVAAGVTSAAPALARLLRVISDLPAGSVILPDFDLSMDASAWDELGRAGRSDEPGGKAFAGDDAFTHPQYHLKLLLNRMGVAREEVRQWHRKGMGAAAPERTHAISSLFLPPEASKVWVDLPAEKRRMAGIRLIESATIEEEAQCVALLARQALEEPEKRIAVITPDRALARRVAQHFQRWNISADDSAGQPLNLTPAGRFLLQLAQLLAGGCAPVELVAALGHPFVERDGERGNWLDNLRKFERELRGPRPAEGLEPLRVVAQKAGVEEWWDGIADQLERLAEDTHGPIALADGIDRLTACAEAMAGERLWSNEDGRALSRFVEDLRRTAQTTGTVIEAKDLHRALSDAMADIAVRPSYGGHPRVAIYGLLESRMTRADLVICSGLNEGSWPGIPGSAPLLPPAILRTLGIPGADFRIGLSAHDLAGALGAPKVVLTRAARDTEGPTIPSRFLLRIKALLGDLAPNYVEQDIPQIAQMLDRQAARAPDYPRPAPDPSAKLRNVPIKVTGLDRLLGDPYQFYASEILKLRALDPLDADPSPAWKGTIAHLILQRWHNARTSDSAVQIEPIADAVLRENNVHPIVWGLWRPRLLAGLEWVAETIDFDPERQVLKVEADGSMEYLGVRVYGRADRIDRLPDGSLGIVDYKTGNPPSAGQVEAGYALQLGTLGLIAREGDFEGISGDATAFEYWSLAKAKTKEKGTHFGFVGVPMKVGRKTKGLVPDEFLPRHEQFLTDAITRFIKGAEPFTARLNPDYPGYADYDQLMRLEEWQIRLADGDDGPSDYGHADEGQSDEGERA
ncbi:MAG: double-strand break repair protein AddB [Erythrobacter sp.]